MTRDANRPNKPNELLLWLRGRYPNDTNELRVGTMPNCGIWWHTHLKKRMF
jgi:hypothetical protein